MDDLALVAQAKREPVLRAHRFRLRREDLEDCYSQATLELIDHVMRGGRFVSRAHIANALELRFVSRIHDRRRALSGRSSVHAALERSLSLSDAYDEGIEIADERAAVERLAILREDLRLIARSAGGLTDDQRRVLAAQVAGETSVSACTRLQWSPEKYRKVAQRARARLRQLVALEHGLVPGE